MKVFLKFLLLIGVLGIIAIVVVGMSLNALVKTGVETMGPKILGVPVVLEEVDISLLSGGKAMQGSLTELVIKNPPGYETDYAFSLPNVRIKVDRNSVLTDTVLVEEVVIDGPAITFEGSLLGSNLSDIQDNVKRVTKSDFKDGGGEKSPSEGSKEQKEKNVQINRVIVKNAQINLSLMGLQGEAIKLTLPDIELRDIGKKSGGTSFQKASAKIFDAIYAAIIKAVTSSGKLIPKGLDQLGESAGDLGKVGKELLKGLFDK